MVQRKRPGTAGAGSGVAELGRPESARAAGIGSTGVGSTGGTGMNARNWQMLTTRVLLTARTTATADRRSATAALPFK
jgi:hypothetical protein